MKKNSQELIADFEAFFAQEPTTADRSWGIIHDFYHYLLTYMDKEGITRAELARRTGKSRSAITQMFNKTPNLTIKKMVEIADAVGLEFSLVPHSSKSSQKYRSTYTSQSSKGLASRMEVNED